MKNYHKALKQIDFNTIVFIVGNVKGCIVFDIDGEVSMLHKSLENI
ncbi:hypothetical protein [Marinifilum fragile]|nr:hypothetical protein [Marinifilum fragile]